HHRCASLTPRAACCAFGGTFAVKNADTSVAMGSDKVDDVVSVGAEVLTAGDTSCLMHLGRLLSRRPPAPPPTAGPGHAPGRDPGRPRVRRMTMDVPTPRRTRPEPSFAGTPPFPEAARTA